MNLKTIRTLIIIAVIVGLLVWIKIKKDADEAAKIAVPAAQGQAILVSGFVATPQSVDNKVAATGSIMANEEVELKCETAGKITNLSLREGARVRKGDLLVKINDADLQAQLKKAQSLVKLDEDNEAREKKLLEINGISKEEYDVALTTLFGAKADVELIEAQIQKTEIKAPFDGIVGLKNVSEGSYISNTNVVANLEQLDPMKIDFSIPEKYMNQVKVGDVINFSVAGSQENYKGEIYAIEPRIDIASRTLEIRAHAPNREGKLRSGAFATIELVLAHLDSVIMVPTQAIVPALKSQLVYVSKDGFAVPKVVETGIRTDVSIQITKGLDAGDTVITTGIMLLRPGLPVKVTDVIH